MQKLPIAVYVIAIVGFLSALGIGVIAPILPTLGNFFGVGTTAMSLAISGLAAARLAANLVFARKLDRWSLTWVLGLGLLLQGVATVAAGLSPDFGVFIALRCVAGVGSAAFTTTATAILIALAPPNKRGSAMSLYFGAFALGTVSGPALGAGLAVVGPQAPLLWSGSAMLAGAALTLVTLRTVSRTFGVAGKEGIKSAQPEGSSLLEIIRDRPMAAALVCQFVTGWVFYGLRVAYLPAYLEGFGLAVGFIGLLLTLAAAFQLAGNTFAGAVSDRIGRIPVILTGLILALCALGMVAFPSIPILVLLSFILTGLAASFLGPPSSAMLGDREAGRTGKGAALYWIMFDLAAILGPIASGVLGERIDPGAPLIVAGLIVTAAFFIAFRARKAEFESDKPDCC
jgi:MFS family permease